MRSGRWTGRDAESQGCLRLFSPSIAGLTPSGARGKGVSNSHVHHNDLGSLSGVHKEVAAMQGHIRQLITAALHGASHTTQLPLSSPSSVDGCRGPAGRAGAPAPPREHRVPRPRAQFG